MRIDRKLRIALINTSQFEIYEALALMGGTELMFVSASVEYVGWII